MDSEKKRKEKPDMDSLRNVLETKIKCRNLFSQRNKTRKTKWKQGTFGMWEIAFFKKKKRIIIIIFDSKNTKIC